MTQEEHPVTSRPTSIRRVGPVLLLAAAAACTSGAPPGGHERPAGTGQGPAATASQAAATASPPAPPGTLPSPRPAAPATPTPAARSVAPATPGPADPPIALLDGLVGAPVAGDLGTFMWDGLVSDAPWVIGTAAGRARRGGALSVAFQPAGLVTGWTARWARVVGGDVGGPSSAGSGSGAAIDVTAPGTVGRWSLQVSVRFGPDRNATWYWQVGVAR
jgi:hypothetical protein